MTNLLLIFKSGMYYVYKLKMIHDAIHGIKIFLKKYLNVV